MDKKKKADKKKAARPVEEIERDIEEAKKELAECRGSDCEVYTRIVGYYRSVKNWNKGKREEYGERKLFKENNLRTEEMCACGNEHAAMAHMEAPIAV